VAVATTCGLILLSLGARDARADGEGWWQVDVVWQSIA
jgi:hypothetical protein